MLAATATVTKVMRKEIVKVLEINGCAVVSVFPNKPNISYSVKRHSGSIDEDLGFLTADLLSNNIKAKRVIVYCQSLDMLPTSSSTSCVSLEIKAIILLVPSRSAIIVYLACFMPRQTTITKKSS